MDDFLTASRSLFNRYFRELDPEANFHRALDRRALYSPIEETLFRALVLAPCQLDNLEYRSTHPQIMVIPNGDFDLPAMLNREIDGGYWDFPLEKLPRDTKLSFISFFDWSEVGRMDHRYVRAVVTAAPQMSEIEGKHCLIETQYVRFIFCGRGAPGSSIIESAQGRNPP